MEGNGGTLATVRAWRPYQSRWHMCTFNLLTRDCYDEKDNNEVPELRLLVRGKLNGIRMGIVFPFSCMAIPDPDFLPYHDGPLLRYTGR